MGIRRGMHHYRYCNIDDIVHITILLGSIGKIYNILDLYKKIVWSLSSNHDFCIFISFIIISIGFYTISKNGFFH